ncbi:MAG TPA: indolepyruvate oxidoreductase subunit beta family protein [Steroidobacteraceae bacterium]|nr:indolepyruvate oxidoreductase subunit beta family protein [Steroidobacteraceae bacterium]
MPPRIIKLTIAALGGQGGAVLTDWLIAIAEANDYIVQATSVPGVAQRTGATIYYLEFCPRAEAVRHGAEPVMALMPVAGDVDCVVASELAEAGRAIARGLVDPRRTTLISSTHRVYAIGEKSALGDGLTDPQQLLELVRTQGKRSILFDMEQTAQKHRSVISAVLLGAISGAGVLPFPRDSFTEAIVRSGIAVATNLAAFEDAHGQAGSGAAQPAARERAELGPVPETARTPALQPLLERVRRLPRPAQPLTLEGVRRTLDYQDSAYAGLYLERLERIALLETSRTASGTGALTQAVARSLALWMTFEDTIRVADLKTRLERFARVRTEIGAAPGQLFGITEFLRPGVAEIAGTLPAALGGWVLRSPRVVRRLGRLTGGRQVRTTTVSGFLLLRAVARLKRWRRATWRFRQENARIESWLAAIERHASTHPDLAVELARSQRLIKGYGETYERGWRNFSAVTQQLERLAARPDGAVLLSGLQEAALADEEGTALARAISSLPASVAASPA